jgi:hypothetical protein
MRIQNREIQHYSELRETGYVEPYKYKILQEKENTDIILNIFYVTRILQG